MQNIHNINNLSNNGEIKTNGKEDQNLKSKDFQKINEENLEISTKKEIEVSRQIVKLMNELPGNKLKFGFNEEAGIGTISVYDRENENLISEFPSQDFFNRLAFFKDNILPGLLLDRNA